MGLRTAKFSRTASLSFFVFVLAGSLHAAPKLRLFTTTFGPYSIASGTNSSAQTIEAFNAGDGSLSLTVTAPASAAWLTASVETPRACQSVTRPSCLPIRLAFQTAALANGTYTTEVTVSDPNALDAPQVITVTVKIGGGIPDQLDLYVAPNGSSTSGTVSTTAAVPFSVATNSGGQWLSVASSGGGSFLFGVTYTVSATHQSGMAEGNYQGSVAFSRSTFAPDNKTMQVLLHVTSQPIADVPQSMRFRVVEGAGLQTQQLNVSNRGSGNLTVTGVTASGGDWLTAGSPGTTTEIAADPTGLTPGVYTGSLAIATNAVNGPFTVPVELQVVAPSAPWVYYGGAVNIGSWSANDAAAAGDIVSVWGEQLCDQVRAAEAVPLPTQLGPTRVLVNGRAAPLYYASPGQVNIQVPFETETGEVVVRVERDGQTGNGVATQVAPRAPHILPFGEYGIIWNFSQNNSFPMPPMSGVPTSRAHTGDVFVIWSTGLGQGNPSVDSGAGAPLTEPLSRVSGVRICFGRGLTGCILPTNPIDVAMTPTLVGLYQVAVTIPADAPRGDRVPLYLELDGRSSNQVLVAIE